MKRLLLVALLAACGSKKPATAPTHNTAGSGAAATDSRMEAGAKPDDTGKKDSSAEEDPCAVPPH